jgi:hypothetical protein
VQPDKHAMRRSGVGGVAGVTGGRGSAGRSGSGIEGSTKTCPLPSSPKLVCCSSTSARATAEVDPDPEPQLAPLPPPVSFEFPFAPYPSQVQFMRQSNILLFLQEASWLCLGRKWHPTGRKGGFQSPLRRQPTDLFARTFW